MCIFILIINNYLTIFDINFLLISPIFVIPSVQKGTIIE